MHFLYSDHFSLHNDEFMEIKEKAIISLLAFNYVKFTLFFRLNVKYMPDMCIKHELVLLT